MQLREGDFDVSGVAAAGFPVIFIGRTDRIAFTQETAVIADNVDIYVETLCGGGAGYLYSGVSTPFETRVETIIVKGGAPINLKVQRTVHGPVVATGPGVAFSRKSVQRGRELQTWRAMLAMDRAHNLQEFEAAVGKMVGAGNFLYADKSGNIAFWQAGQIPVRTSGFDPRLPLPGDGSAEWTGDFRPIPASINPTKGWLANWNNKPSVDYDNSDNQLFGKQHRILEIEDAINDRLADGVISEQELREIAEEIGRTKFTGPPFGREARFLKPYLLAALDSAPPAHPLAPEARAVLEAWDGSTVSDSIASTTFEPGEVIFADWLSRTLTNTFGDELGTSVGEANVNTLIHVLDDALGGGSGVPPSRDYFNGIDPNAVMSATFDQTLTALGPTPAAWTKPRTVVSFRRVSPKIPEVGTMFESNKNTYAQVVVLGNPKMTVETILTLGQSGFIQLIPPSTLQLDPHFRDQLELYRSFEYKPMPLFNNTQLEE